jgi:hypothetical protein
VSLLFVAGAGALLEAGCLATWVLSPRLTADYNSEFSQRYLAALPALAELARVLPPFPDVDSKAIGLQAVLLVMISGYVAGVASLATLKSADVPVHATGWLLAGVGLLAQATLATMPGLFSTDIFSYVMYGRIAAVYGQNPYVLPPSAFPSDVFADWVFPFWREQPSVYGPLWTDLSWWLSSRTAAWPPLEQVLAYRAVLNGFQLANLALLWWLLGRLQREPIERLRAFALFAWNPLVVFELAGNAHNDVAMVCLLLAGLALIVSGRRWVIGCLVILLGALIKFATGLAAVLIATSFAARHGRVQALGAGSLALIVTTLVCWPWLEAPGALVALGGAAEGRLVINSAPDVVALTIADQLRVSASIDQDTAITTARFWTRLVARTAFAIYFGWELRRVWRTADLAEAIRASTRALLVLPLLVLTWVWSWYFTWSLALATLLGWRSRLTQLTVAYSVMALPVVYARQYWNERVPGIVVVLFAALPPLVLLAVLMTTRGRARQLSTLAG